MDGQSSLSTSPGLPHLRCNRRASEASIASQVSGLADAYTASNIASSKFTCRPRDSVHKVTICWQSRLPLAHKVSHTQRPSLKSVLALPYHKCVTRASSFRSYNKVHQVFHRPNSVESEHSSALTPDMTSGIKSDSPDVSSNITDISSTPPSPRVSENVEQGILGAVV